MMLVMLPIFKSHYSIGKSILTLDHNKLSLDEGSDSIFSLLSEGEIKKLILVEDSLTGFLQALKGCEKLGIDLIFGLRCLVCNDLADEDKEKSLQKVIIFPKNGEGCALLNKIHTKAQTEHGGMLDFVAINKEWDDSLLKMAIPFYDSFIFNNALTFSNCVPDFSLISPDFFVEDNGLPFDLIIKKRVADYCKDNNFRSRLTKSIYYNNKDDFDAYTTYKCICNRRHFSSSLDKPNFDHLGSREFCFQSWKEANRK